MPDNDEGLERVGVFGGTFDPPHGGHVSAAVAVRDALALDRLLMVVAGDPWQKRGGVAASASDRAAMVGAAIEGLEGIELSTMEIERGGETLTVDTLRELRRPGRKLYLVVGSDAARLLNTWRDVERIRTLATLVIVERAGDHVEPPGQGWDVVYVPMPRVDVSSTRVRELLRQGAPLEGLVPSAVVRVIEERGLYTAP